jgi:hypothetical protein
MRIRRSFIAAAACVAASAHAAEDRWSFGFGQGIAEYAVGSFAEGSSHLALSCAESGLKPGSVSVDLARAGFLPRGPTPATFITDKGQVTMSFDAQGWAAYPNLAAASDFRTLWRLLATAKTLRISYGPGEPMTFPVAGAAQLLGGTVCSEQLAQ